MLSEHPVGHKTSIKAFFVLNGIGVVEEGLFNGFHQGHEAMPGVG